MLAAIQAAVNLVQHCACCHTIHSSKFFLPLSRSPLRSLGVRNQAWAQHACSLSQCFWYIEQAKQPLLCLFTLERLNHHTCPLFLFFLFSHKNFSTTSKDSVSVTLLCYSALIFCFLRQAAHMLRHFHKHWFKWGHPKKLFSRMLVPHITFEDDRCIAPIAIQATCHCFPSKMWDILHSPLPKYSVTCRVSGLYHLGALRKFVLFHTVDLPSCTFQFSGYVVQTSQ